MPETPLPNTKDDGGNHGPDLGPVIAVGTWPLYLRCFAEAAARLHPTFTACGMNRLGSWLRCPCGHCFCDACISKPLHHAASSDYCFPQRCTHRRSRWSAWHRSLRKTIAMGFWRERALLITAPVFCPRTTCSAFINLSKCYKAMCETYQRGSHRRECRTDGLAGTPRPGPEGCMAALRELPWWPRSAKREGIPTQSVSCVLSFMLTHAKSVVC
jgi:hypothetical protein